MKILVFGKNGQLGAEILHEGLKFKHKLIGATREDVDICNYDQVSKVISKYKPDVIINTAAMHAASHSEIYPEELFAINSFAIHNIAIITREKKIKFINYSTDYVFDGTKGKPYIEEDIPNPLHMYGLSKYTGEIIASNYDENSITIRTCGVYGGISGSRIKGNFVLNMLREARNAKVIEVSSEQIVSPTYAVDLAYATFKLLGKKPKGGIYHLVNSGYCSWAEFAQEIMNLKKNSITINPLDRKGLSGGIKRPTFSALANVKAKQLGVELPSWKNALKRYIEFLPHSI